MCWIKKVWRGSPPPDGQKIHSLRVGWRNLFSSCAVCCVSFWFWREKGFGSILVQIRIYYLVGSGGKLAVSLLWRENFITTEKKRYSRLSVGCAVQAITTGKKRYSHLSGGCAIIITTEKKRYSRLSLVAIIIFVLVQLESNLIQIH